MGLLLSPDFLARGRIYEGLCQSAWQNSQVGDRFARARLGKAFEQDSARVPDSHPTLELLCRLQNMDIAEHLAPA